MSPKTGVKVSIFLTIGDVPLGTTLFLHGGVYEWREGIGWYLMGRPLLFYGVFFYLVVQCLPCDTENPGRIAFISVGVAQHPDNMVFFHLIERFKGRGYDLTSLAEGNGQIFRLDDLPIP